MQFHHFWGMLHRLPHQYAALTVKNEDKTQIFLGDFYILSHEGTFCEIRDTLIHTLGCRRRRRHFLDTKSDFVDWRLFQTFNQLLFNKMAKKL